MNNNLEQIKYKLPTQDEIYDLAELFKVFGDSTRTGILCVLEKSELCVSDIAEILEMSVSAISHQLRVLRTFKLVKSRKEGKDVYYSLDDEHVTEIIKCGLSHINE